MTGFADEHLIRKRQQVGIIAGGCLVVAGFATVFGSGNTAWSASCFRIGVVLGALWLALPTKTRPAAWANMSRWTIVGIMVFAAFLPRLKWFLPILILGIAIGWLLRRKTWRRRR